MREPRRHDRCRFASRCGIREKVRPLTDPVPSRALYYQRSAVMPAGAPQQFGRTATSSQRAGAWAPGKRMDSV
jgi:hypothetical protein